MGNIIECDNLYKIYKEKDIEVLALQGLDLIVEQGECMAVIGSSGSGKSTFLNILGGLDKPTTGKLLVNGMDMSSLSEKQLRIYKKDVVGFVWQNSGRNLLSHLTALENAELVVKLSKKYKNYKARALELLEMTNIAHRKNSRVTELSGGEQQRVSIALALANDPKILLADEPTGAVDTKTTADILKLFNELNKSLNLTIVIVTHDMQIAHSVNRVVSISDGKIHKELIIKKDYAQKLKTMEALHTNINSGDTHEEYIVVDGYGRVQLPQQFLNKLNIKGKSKIKAKINNEGILLHK
jgi:ABC-type lipoprotein export system ATPase subunit